jgi:CRP-like cAMP-binding protein
MRGYNATDANRSPLDDLPILRFLPEQVRKLIKDSFVPASFTFGQPIVREGEPADGFYVLMSGQARVVKQRENGEDISLNLLRPGDSFGEMGLLEEASRNATVRATGDVTTLKLDRSVFQALIRAENGGHVDQKNLDALDLISMLARLEVPPVSRRRARTKGRQKPSRLQ